MKYTHLRRYGTRGKRDEITSVEVRGDSTVCARGRLWDLRTGERSKGFVKGFYASPDGRYCEYEERTLVVVHPDGRRVPLGFSEEPRALSDGYLYWVGPHLVARDQYDGPWIVMDAETGASLGRLKKQPAAGGVASVFDPQDGKTLVFCDGRGVYCLDVAARTFETILRAPKTTTFIGAVLGSAGAVLLLQRPTRNDQIAAQQVVLRDARGEEIARLTDFPPPFQIRRLGSSYLITHDQGFVIVDDSLREVARVPFVDDDNFARTLVLPSGREWIAIGGFGQWDHYGDAALAPGRKTATRRATLRRP